MLKIGDVVKVKENKSRSSQIYNGKIGKIQRIEDGIYGKYAILDIDKNNNGIWLNELTLVQETKSKTTLPTDSNERKEYPLFRGVLRYFPAALAGIARISKQGNDKHNPGEEMHHARSKSSDQGDCILRHLTDIEDLLAAMERGDTTVTKQEVLNEVNQMAWRALALSQEIHEKFGAPMAPGAKK